MQEIAQQVYIENSYAGVTLGAINWPHGLVLIDAPIRPEDARSWRSALLNLGGGVDRMQVTLDSHLDRTLGSRAMDCTVVGHEKLVQVFRNRPVTFKTQTSETGSEYELHNGLGSIRWAPPEITFTDSLQINWNDSPLCLEYRPGTTSDAIWAVLPKERVVFVGDAVTVNQPPFLGFADLPQWIAALRTLQEPRFRDFLIVSGRGGLVANEQLHLQINFLEQTLEKLENLAAKSKPAESAEELALSLCDIISGIRKPQHIQRLQWGLRQYYAHHYCPTNEEISEE